MRVVRKKTDGERAFELVNEIRDEILRIKNNNYEIEKIVLTEEEYKLLEHTIWYKVDYCIKQETLLSYPIEIENEIASFIAAHGSKCIMDYINNY